LSKQIKGLAQLAGKSTGQGRQPVPAKYSCAIHPGETTVAAALVLDLAARVDRFW
jgi:hypothetical protein